MKVGKTKVNVNIESLFVGEEPVWGDPKKELPLIRALNWYSNQLSPKESKKYTLDYVKKYNYSQDIIEKLSSAQDYIFKNLGFVCRMILRGADLDRKDWINDKIEEIITYVPSENIVSQPSIKPEKNIQERIFDQATAYINEVEGFVDAYIKERKSDFKCYEWLKSSDIKPVYAKQIENHYRPMLDELELAYNKKDEQLVEAYSHWSKKELSNFCEFIKNIVNGCYDHSSNTKVVRKTRKKKAIPLEKKVSSVKYKREDNEFKIVSINPAEILAAKQLWVFNTKYKTLGVYNSEDDAGFSVKGTTITGFNETTSIQKTLRKPADFLPIVTKGKKSELKKLMESISTKEQALTGRLNEEIILLKVLK